MDAVRIRHLRSLADTGSVYIRPLTLFVGRNSSGKSTFLRFFPLLRQSVETRTTGPVLWYGSLVDFGDFDEALWTGATEPVITFDFKFSLPLRDEIGVRSPKWTRPSTRTNLLGNLEINASVRLTSDSRDGATRCVGVVLEFSGHRVQLEFSADGVVEKFMVNAFNVLTLDAHFLRSNSGGLLPSLIERPKSYSEADELDPFVDAVARRTLTTAFVSSVRPLFHGNTKETTIQALLHRLGVGSDQQMLDQIRSFKEGGDYWKKRAAGLRVGSSRFSRIRDLVIAGAVSEILYQSDSYLSRCAANTSYIGPFRATAERYYRTQALAVEEVDYEGRNLAMFLRSLTDTERRNFQEWTSQHFGLSVATRLAGGHLSLRVTDLELDTEFNLADVGFGFSQVLPVLAQLWSLIYRSRRRAMRRQVPLFLAIEQPELHLHPSLQARLADVFLTSVLAARKHGVDLRLIIETHSETIINRIGNRVYEGDIPEDIASVVIFEGGGKQGSSLRLSRYDEEGFLTNWPLGFFQPEPIDEDREVTVNVAETYVD